MYFTLAPILLIEFIILGRIYMYNSLFLCANMCRFILAIQKILLRYIVICKYIPTWLLHRVHIHDAIIISFIKLGYTYIICICTYIFLRKRYKNMAPLWNNPPLISRDIQDVDYYCIVYISFIRFFAFERSKNGWNVLKVYRYRYLCLSAFSCFLANTTECAILIIRQRCYRYRIGYR